MFLNLLSKQEQELFLELTYYAIGLDGVYHDEEIKLFNSYKNECHILDYEPSMQHDINLIIKQFEASSSITKRAILIELFGIVLADGEFCDEEQKFMNELAEKFEISSDDFEILHKWAVTMSQIIDVGYKLIHKKI